MSPFTVVEGRWAPVSAGEYDRRTRTMSTNLTVIDAVHARFGDDRALIRAAIVAHEQAHADASGEGSALAEERRARQAAVLAGGREVVDHIDAVLAEAWA